MATNKKVAFVTGIFPRMSETFVLSQIERAVKHGFDVTIYASESEEGTQLHHAVEELGLLDRARYYGKLGTWVRKPVLQRWFGALKDFLNAGNKAPLLRSLNVFRFGLKTLSLRRWNLARHFGDLGLEQFDVVHCQFGPYGVFCAQLKDLGIIRGRLITSFHGYDMSQHLQKTGQHTYDHLFKTGDQFLPISEHWHNKLIKLGCPREKISVHRMGIDLSTYVFQDRVETATEHTRFLAIGRLVEKKGIEFAIRALKQASEKQPDLSLDIVGDGPLRNELEQMTRDLGLTDRVRFCGWQTQAEIRAHISDATVLVTPSVTARDGDQEGIPMVLMEAMASGLPVISTYHSGIPELVQDKVSGRLVPERDVEGLANAMGEVAREPGLRRQYASEARKRVEDQFNLHRLNDRLVQIYEKDNWVSV